ncbi:hypothetical protein IAU59_002536 [Kwoniella sp. CBS 9459]
MHGLFRPRFARDGTLHAFRYQYDRGNTPSRNRPILSATEYAQTISNSPLDGAEPYNPGLVSLATDQIYGDQNAYRGGLECVHPGSSVQHCKYLNVYPASTSIGTDPLSLSDHYTYAGWQWGTGGHLLSPSEIDQSQAPVTTNPSSAPRKRDRFRRIFRSGRGSSGEAGPSEASHSGDVQEADSGAVYEAAGGEIYEMDTGGGISELGTETSHEPRSGSGRRSYQYY